MARAETVTKLPTDEYFRLMQISLCHGNQVAGAKAPLSAGCDDVWDQPAREALTETMGMAEQLIEGHLGFFLVPTFVTCEEHRVGRVRGDWWNAEFSTRWSKVQSFGRSSLTVVELDSPVTYEDRDGDAYGREETAVIGDPAALYSWPLTACDDVCDVRVFFRHEDGAWDDADPRWEIRPVKPDRDAELTITAESCLFVRPSFWEITEYEDPDDWKVPFDTDNLVDAVDVYCQDVDQSLPVTLYWDNVCGCTTSPCAHTTQDACPLGTNMDRGHFAVRPATWSGTAHVWTSPTYDRPPIKFTVDYLSGMPLDPRTCRMDGRLARAVVKLTNALLPEPPCAYCDLGRQRWEQDRQPVDPLTPEAASMPWDIYSRGALEAWRIVKQMARIYGGSVRGG